MSDVQKIEPIGNLVPEVGGHGLPPSLQILLNEGLYTRIKQLSGVMANARGVTPAHLIDKPEACFSIINMSLDWKLSPHFVARHTYQTPAGVIGFDGALTQSILEQSGRFIGAPKLEYRGDWQSLVGKYKLQTGQRGGTFAVPTWTPQDALGLGVIVRWKVKGEAEPRVWPGEDNPFWLHQCFPLNSPLWATDPKTQIAYLAIRRFANLTSPGILGAAAFDQDELLDASERAVDVTQQPPPRRESYSIPAESAAADIGREFVVVDLDGVENLYATGEAAVEVFRICLEEAARLGPDRLDGWLEDNRAAIESLPAAGFGKAAAELMRAYDDARKPPAEAAAEPSPSERQEQWSDPPRHNPATREEVVPDQKANAESGDKTEAPGRDPGATPQPWPLDPAPPPADPHPEVAVPVKNHKPLWSTWAFLLRQKVLRCKTSNDLAHLLGANEQHLERARAPGSMAAADLAEMERVIAEQWKTVPAA